jgi:hypothetical protein
MSSPMLALPIGTGIGATTDSGRGSSAPRLEEKPGSDDQASEPGIFAELVSISSTRSAGVSDSAYFIESIELRPTLDLFLSVRKEVDPHMKLDKRLLYPAIAERLGDPLIEASMNHKDVQEHGRLVSP